MRDHNSAEMDIILLQMIGALVWGVDAGFGTFLTFEVGAPHLTVRDPVLPLAENSEKVNRALGRRRVSVAGDWHVWIKHARWELKTKNGEATSSDVGDTRTTECLSDLDGQLLKSCNLDLKLGTLILNFDLGAQLSVRANQEGVDDVWSIHAWQGKISTFRSDGQIIIE